MRGEAKVNKVPRRGKRQSFGTETITFRINNVKLAHNRSRNGGELPRFEKKKNSLLNLGDGKM